MDLVTATREGSEAAAHGVARERCAGERRVRHVIGVAKAHDHVRDAEILEHADAVGRVRVQRDHVDLERLAFASVVTSKLRQTPEVADEQIVVASRVHPASPVAARSAGSVPADEDGCGAGGTGRS